MCERFSFSTTTYSGPPNLQATAERGFSDEKIALGPAVEFTRFSPGRFANVIQSDTRFRHARQAVREDRTSSFVLNLGPDGSVTLCRGWRYVSFNDGPTVHTSEDIREQLGYRGHWEHSGAGVQVDVVLDDSICARVGQYSHLVPDHASQWSLLFLPIAPGDHPLLTTAALFCRPAIEPTFGEDEPHLVSGILPGECLVLGAGNGIRIKVTRGSVNAVEDSVIQVEHASEPIQTNAWEHSF